MKVSNLVFILSILASFFLNPPAEVHIQNYVVEAINFEPEKERIIEVLDGSSFDFERPVIEDKPIIEEREVSQFNIDGLTLQQGVYNEQVIRIERFLKEKGYVDIVEDNYLDKKTSDAIINYKKSLGLDANGIIDRDTYVKINEDMEKNKIIIPKIELSFAENIPMEEWIIINKSNNTLYHLNGNEIIRTYPVATGKTPSHTPSGKFTIITKYINPAWGGAGIYKPVKGGAPNNPLGKRWMGLSIKGGGTYGIHGNSDSTSIGKYITLGCVRMFNEDIEYLYDIINYDTHVWIGDEDKLKEFGVSFNFKVYMDAAINKIPSY